MATDSAPNVNGNYDTQFSQPAELAASTPSHTSSQAPSTSSMQQKADPQEIGWYFVEQYYTTLSKTPERIHLFYSKKSQLVTGTEAEKIVPAVGSKAISEKIKTLDIQDCKVRVLNVDSQSSFDNIVVQVIGELSNKSQPHHKFVQTFVLATQPNGYFVLNDIFRYLSDEEDQVVEDQTTEDQVQVAESTLQNDEPSVNKTADSIENDESADQGSDEKLHETSETPIVAVEEDADGADTKAEAEEPATDGIIEDIPSEPVNILPTDQPTEPAAAPTAEISSQPVAEAPPARKTWAEAVGNKAPAIPALPTTAVGQPKTTRPVQPVTAPKTTLTTPESAQVPAPTTNTSATPLAFQEQAAAPTASQNNGWQMADHGKKAKTPQQKATEGIVHAYIKNVTDKVDARILKEVLEKYGELRYFDVSRPRNCAFVEFAEPSGYAAAVAANPHDVGGEAISVEERRPRPGQFGSNNSNTNFNRGGSTAGRGRGSVQGRNGSQGNFQKDVRGGFLPRGNKSGNVTPKGRGQVQAA